VRSFRLFRQRVMRRGDTSSAALMPGAEPGQDKPAALSSPRPVFSFRPFVRSQDKPAALPPPPLFPTSFIVSKNFVCMEPVLQKIIVIALPEITTPLEHPRIVFSAGGGLVRCSAKKMRILSSGTFSLMLTLTLRGLQKTPQILFRFCFRRLYPPLYRIRHCEPFVYHHSSCYCELHNNRPKTAETSAIRVS